ncbi:MAG TPA: hypothetical protein VMF08_19920 [Candidatus Sulfotelmatobacter sp.]|nr:hypothetical protein [Candidatus Sulfotelmatobacter sp.]
MRKHTAKIALIGLIAAGIAVPLFLSAQDAGTNATDTATAPATPHKHKHGARFHGTVDNLDTNAMTLTVGSQTFDITSKTKITSNGEPATLADGVLGEKVSGYYRTNEDGDLHATAVHFGAHKKKADDGDSTSTTSTNAPAGN